MTNRLAILTILALYVGVVWVESNWPVRAGQPWEYDSHGVRASTQDRAWVETAGLLCGPFYLRPAAAGEKELDSEPVGVLPDLDLLPPSAARESTEMGGSSKAEHQSYKLAVDGSNPSRPTNITDRSGHDGMVSSGFEFDSSDPGRVRSDRSGNGQQEVVANAVATIASGPDSVSSGPGAGPGRASLSTHGADGPRVITARLTYYTDIGRMRTGYYTFDGAVSVDPACIPHGSIIQIEGDSRLRVALDTGGLVKGCHVDVWVASDAEGRAMIQALGTRVQVAIVQGVE